MILLTDGCIALHGEGACYDSHECTTTDMIDVQWSLERSKQAVLSMLRCLCIGPTRRYLSPFELVTRSSYSRETSAQIE